jgi:hypothetical protein
MLMYFSQKNLSHIKEGSNLAVKAYLVTLNLRHRKLWQVSKMDPASDCWRDKLRVSLIEMCQLSTSFFYPQPSLIFEREKEKNRALQLLPSSTKTMSEKLRIKRFMYYACMYICRSRSRAWLLPKTLCKTRLVSTFRVWITFRHIMWQFMYIHTFVCEHCQSWRQNQYLK